MDAGDHTSCLRMLEICNMQTTSQGPWAASWNLPGGPRVSGSPIQNNLPLCDPLVMGHPWGGLIVTPTEGKIGCHLGLLIT